MQRETRNERINQLKNEGFKNVTGNRSLYINKTGKVFSLKKDKFLKPTKNLVRIEGKALNIGKMVLETFKGLPYKPGQISYIDGNKENLSIENLKYKSLFDYNETVVLNKDNLMKSIKCYFNVEKGFNLRDAVRTHFYLQMITKKRAFFELRKDKQHIEIFKTYVNGTNKGTISMNQTAKIHGITVRDCTIIINEFLNVLSTDIIRDLKKGLLHIHDKPPKTKTDLLKDINNRIEKLEQEKKNR